MCNSKVVWKILAEWVCIMADKLIRQGKKNRKIGRNRRKPAKVRYTNEKRWIRNKALRIAREMKDHPNWKPDKNTGDEVMAKVREQCKKQK